MHNCSDINEIATPPARGGAEVWVLKHFWLLLGGLLILRLVAATLTDLVPDEAVYWAWSRHLAPGYFDHPPMIALLNWITTHLLGNTVLAVRLPAILLSLGSLAVLAHLAAELFRDARAVGFVILMWAVSPLLAVLGMISTPDPPATFFSVCALACAVRIADREDRGQGERGAAKLWILFGLFSGLALVSKYTTILVPAGVGLAMLTTRRGWRQLATPWPYLSAVVALVVFSPVVWWNATHHWASFAFQLHHGAGEAGDVHQSFGQVVVHRIAGLGEFLAGQAVVWTPILFGVGMVVVVDGWRRMLRVAQASRLCSQTDPQPGSLCYADRILLWCGTLPLVFFGWAAMRTRGEINWPAFAWFPISLLTARYLMRNWGGKRVDWVRGGCRLALGCTIAIHLVLLPWLPGLFKRLHRPLPHNLTDLRGWKAFGEVLAEAAGGAPVVCNRHQDAAEASFYMPGQPDVWCDGVGSRPTAYDYFENPPDFTRIPRVLFVGGHVGEFMAKHGYTHAERFRLDWPGSGKHGGRDAALLTRTDP